MDWARLWHELVFFLRRLAGRRRAERDLDEEIRAHLELETQENVERGMSPEEARYAALRAFGNVTLTKEESRAMWGTRSLEMLSQDVRYGLRMIARNPGFTAVVVLTLALGIGANTAIFSVVNAVLLKPLPYKDADRLAMLWTDDPKHGVREEGTSTPTFEDWRSQSRLFEDMALCSRGDALTLTGAGEPERVEAARVSTNFFPLLGVPPLLGRIFSPEEVERRDRVVVLSHELWQRRFGASPEAIGMTLEIGGRGSRVIGVMPGEFQFPSKGVALWEPITLDPWWDRNKERRHTDWWRVVGRLKPGVTTRQAQVEMDLIGDRLARAYPTADPGFAGFGVNVVPLSIQLIGENLRLALWLLQGAVAFVLLIACANVANLMLARGAARAREFAVRTALGAGRGRLLRQMLTESLVLSMAGGLLGVVLALIGTRALVVLSPANIPRLAEAGLNVKVLAFTLCLSLLAGVVFGLAPALKASSSKPDESLKGGGRGGPGGAGGRRVRDSLVVAEFALAVVLLVGAGLLVRSFQRLRAVDPGFRPERVLIMKVHVPDSKTRAQKAAFYNEALDRVRALPGVQAAGAISNVFLEYNPDIAITVEGPRPAGQPAGPLMDDVASAGYFEAMGIPLLRGRTFGMQDGPETPRVAVINETMARRFFPGEDPVGKRFKYGDVQSTSPPLTIVGVVGDVRREGLEREPIPQIFIALAQNPNRGMSLSVRTVGDPTGLAAAVRREIHAIDKTLPLFGVTTVERRLAEMEAPRRFQMWLLGLFSALALLLAALGIYGLVRYAVAQRRQEIGIRMALGAERRDVLWLVMEQAMRMAVAGIGLGLGGACVLTRLMASLLYGVSATDPLTFAGIALLLAGVALTACYLPAKRAAQVDPLVALRSE